MKFKVGDWIQGLDGEGIFLITNKFLENSYYWTERKLTEDYFKLWKPKLIDFDNNLFNKWFDDNCIWLPDTKENIKTIIESYVNFVKEQQ